MPAEYLACVEGVMKMKPDGSLRSEDEQKLALSARRYLTEEEVKKCPFFNPDGTERNPEDRDRLLKLCNTESEMAKLEQALKNQKP